MQIEGTLSSIEIKYYVSKQEMTNKFILLHAPSKNYTNKTILIVTPYHVYKCVHVSFMSHQ